MGGFGGPGGFGGGTMGPRPKKRPVQLMLILSLSGLIGSSISQVGANSGVEILSLIGGLVGLGGLAAFVMTIIQLLELKSFTNDSEFSWWMSLVCCLNIWFLWSKVPVQVAKARQMAGLAPVTKSPWAYLFLSAWALASDLEELSQ